MVFMSFYNPIPLEDIQKAHKRIKDKAIKTPLVKLNLEDTPGEIYLKLENLQPIRSFKIRGAYNALSLLEPESLKKGVWTVSAGNHAQGLAWSAKQLEIKCTIVLPENAPKTKLKKINEMGAEVIKVDLETYLEIYQTRKYKGLDGHFVHAFSDPDIMAGTGTIGLEILNDLPDVDTILVPWGGGGLACGIASAVKALNPRVKIIACEVDSAAPLSASFKAGEPAKGVDYTPSFVDGIGAPFVLPEMYELAREIVDDVVVVSLMETARAVELLVDSNCVVAEGAGAVSLAAALGSKVGSGKIVCLISGGNIDKEKLVKILQGKTP
jgi:threonine dehydratase